MEKLIEIVLTLSLVVLSTKYMEYRNEIDKTAIVQEYEYVQDIKVDRYFKYRILLDREL